MYKLRKTHGEIGSVIRDNGDGSTTYIPFAEDNTDYQAYLAWVAEGNVPTPAEENT